MASRLSRSFSTTRTNAARGLIMSQSRREGKAVKILKLSAENFQKITVVEITPDGNLIQITGKNGAGKTSLLNSIWVALGGADAMPGMPVRKGADKGHVTLDLGDIVVTRRFDAEGRT